MAATLCAWVLALPLALLSLTFAAEVLAGLSRRQRQEIGEAADVPTIAILIPAHNEAAGIAHTVTKIREHSPADALILVVADNCTDDTCTLAREAGATVMERSDPDRRGKGYALDFGRAHLHAIRPAVVVVLDADAEPEPGCIVSLAREAVRSGRPVQGAYCFQAGSQDVIVAISSFAFMLKNTVRLRGAGRLGIPAVLTGSGMAFPWTLFAAVPLASGHVAEDVALGVDLTLDGSPPLYLDEAMTWSQPSSLSGTTTQRRRWESGFRLVLREQILPLIRNSWSQRRPAAALLALDLMIPPFVMLFVYNAAAAVLLFCLCEVGASSAPLVIQTGAAATALVAVILAWAAHGRSYLPVSSLVGLPRYLLWKVGLSLGVLRRTEDQWIRTERL